MSVQDETSLLSQLEGDVVTAKDDNYAAAIARWAVNAERKAKYVIYPKTTRDIELAVQIARSGKLRLAVRGGGHSQSGASSAEDGVVIDLSRHYAGVRIDAEKKLAYVGGGAIWKTVDEEAAKHGLATVAGTMNETGVGGLTLGGGFGWLTPRHGLAIDNLVEATLVKADGSTVVANETSHTDLFWALRGAGSNFGVVTEFVFKLHEQGPTVTAGFLIFTPDKIPQISEAAQEWVKRADPNGAAVVAFLKEPKVGQYLPGVIAFWNGPKAEAEKNLKLFLDIGPMADLTQEMPYEKLNSMFNEFNKDRLNRYGTGSVFTLDVLSKLDKIFLEYCAIYDANPDLKMELAFECFALDKVKSVPEEATAFSNRATALLTAIVVSWSDPTDSTADRARDVARKLARLSSQTEEPKPGYINYQTDKVDTKKQFSAEKYEKLRTVKKEYDPESLFNSWFPIEA